MSNQRKSYCAMLKASGLSFDTLSTPNGGHEVRCYTGFGMHFSHYFDKAGALVNVSTTSEYEDKTRTARR